VELSNATLTNIEGFTAEDADLTLTVNRADLERVMGGVATLEQLLGEGAATAEGDLAVLGQLAGLMVEFDPRFEIMPGTKALTEVTRRSPDGRVRPILNASRSCRGTKHLIDLLDAVVV
jgi:hypothetical protein